MVALNQVLCPVDLSELSVRALACAGSIAEYLMQNAREHLEALVARQPRLEQGITVEVAAGRAHRQIARVASDMRADLIVLGAHGRGGPPLAALGSTTEQVVRAAPCPVLTVRPPAGHV